MMEVDSIQRAARVISEADAVFIGAGAGMGVDSGLPDFRGDEGFWKAYPPLRRMGISFAQMANPAWFVDKPRMAWAFYGHRFNLYRSTVPHEGFSILKGWAAGKKQGSFVFTSNVDGHFHKAGFGEDRIYECHGSINHLQCTGCGSGDIWEAGAIGIDIDMESLSASGTLPECGRCSAVARPNILMFGDWSWLPERSEAQGRRLAAWVSGAKGGKVAVIECGAGTAVPTVRSNCESFARDFGAALIRINPRDTDGPKGTISIASGALEGLRLIEAEIERQQPGRR